MSRCIGRGYCSIRVHVSFSFIEITSNDKVRQPIQIAGKKYEIIIKFLIAHGPAGWALRGVLGFFLKARDWDCQSMSDTGKHSLDGPMLVGMGILIQDLQKVDSCSAVRITILLEKQAEDRIQLILSNEITQLNHYYCTFRVGNMWARFVYLIQWHFGGIAFF